MAKFSLNARERVILSIAQFRPEKDHPAQLRAFAQLLADQPTYASGSSSVKLILLGRARNAEDRACVQSLQDLATELKITPHVKFIVNASYPEILSWLAKQASGSARWWVNIVEFMAARNASLRAGRLIGRGTFDGHLSSDT